MNDNVCPSCGSVLRRPVVTKDVRNREIVRCRQAGYTYVVIARYSKMSATRVREIYRRWQYQQRRTI
jgi:uncharacterized Zn finger protein